MENKMNHQVDLLERGTYQNLNELQEQIVLFAQQTFENDELDEDDRSDQEEFGNKNQLSLSLENYDSKLSADEFPKEENGIDEDEEFEDDDEEFPKETDDDLGAEEEEEADDSESENWKKDNNLELLKR